MAVARISPNEPKLDQRVQRPAERFVGDSQPAGEDDEASPASMRELGQDGRRPTMVEDLDEALNAFMLAQALDARAR
jgi:hypothetical protein